MCIRDRDKAAVEAHLQTLYDQMRDRQEHWYQDMFLTVSYTHLDVYKRQG